jgi:phosphatidylglycerophosphate synthase
MTDHSAQFPQTITSAPTSGFGVLNPILLALAAGAGALAVPGSGWGVPALALALAAVGLAFAARGLSRGHPHPRLGAANAVTGLRLALVAAVGAAALAGAATRGITPLLALAVLALLLDGVDGALARREGMASPFGARFDMEVDSALALSLAVAVWSALPGPTALEAVSLAVLGGSRYAFALAVRILPWLDRPLPERWSRKAVCVVQIATLLGILGFLPLFPDLRSVLPVVAALVLSSFARDVLWLRNRRRSA